MNKDNFFAKFAHYYKYCFNGIPNRADDIRELLHSLLDLTVNIVGLLVRIINIFIPFLPFIFSLCSRYVDKEETKGWGDSGSRYLRSGYYSKWSIIKFKKRLKKELEEDK